MATLTVEVRHGRNERLPGQVGDQPENGDPGDDDDKVIGSRQNPGRANLVAWNPRGGPRADPHHRARNFDDPGLNRNDPDLGNPRRPLGGEFDPRRPQIGADLGSDDANRKAYFAGHDFRELQVFQRGNRRAFGQRDDDDLRQGIPAGGDGNYEAGSGPPRVAARILDYRGGFFPPAWNVDDFRHQQRGNFRQRQPRGIDYSSGEEDNFQFDHRANNRGQNSQEFKMKMDLPCFDG